MDALLVLVLYLAAAPAQAARFCDRSHMPLELGIWRRDLVHMDTATIDNPPVSVSEGQIYVYENFFPNHTIRYLHVDNLAMKSCGATASLKAGGINTSGVMIVLHSGPYQEIRSVVDIWGTKNPKAETSRHAMFVAPHDLKEMNKLKSRYLFKELRTVNHNSHNDTDSE